MESVRGLASVVVLFHHLALAFLPRAKGPMPGGIANSPIAFLLNGPAAVTLFFVLSGFVLTRRFFEQGIAPGALAMAAAKRLPRLAVPAAASLLLGYLILASGLSFHVEASRLASSVWLRSFAGAGLPIDAAPSLGEAVRQMASVFFQPATEQTLYNSNLWTMRPELLGSLFCFAAVSLLGTLGRENIGGALLAGCATLVSAMLLGEPVLAFLSGMLIARFPPRPALIRGVVPAGLVIVAALLGLSSELFLLQLNGACLLLLALLGCTGLATALSTRWGELLGRISFPLYLVHPAVICSIGGLIYLQLGAVGLPRWAMAIGTMGITATISLVAAVPFLLLDEWWVARLNRISRTIANAGLLLPGLRPAR